MHVAILTHSLPQPSTAGGPMTCWAIMRTLLRCGHRVTVLALRYPWDQFDTPERRQTLLDLGADLVSVPTEADGEPTRNEHRPGRRMRLAFRLATDTQLNTWFPTSRLQPRLQTLVTQLNPDVMFVYHWDSLAASYGVADVPRFAVTGDPWHLPSWRRWQAARPRLSASYMMWTVRTLLEMLRYPKQMVNLLQACEASGCFQAGAAAWLRSRGATECRYLRSPISDAPGSGWQALRASARRSERPRVLLGPSDLYGTATRAGLRLFASDMLPILERELGSDGFEVHVVGGGEPPPELRKTLSRPSVKLRGRVEPADEEFLSADVQLCPTPFVLGIRLRIVTGFSFGCCVVAHSSEAHNLPELTDGHNALLAPSGQGLAMAIVRALRDPALRERLGRNARETYEQCFAPEAAALPIVEELERLARVRTNSRVAATRPRTA